VLALIGWFAGGKGRFPQLAATSQPATQLTPIEEGLT
jgi:hypothetical protein